MIIGTDVLDYELLKTFVGRPKELVDFVEETVPLWARHITCLVHNQRFYVAVHLRNVLTIPYKPRMELVNALTEGISIQGIISSFTPIQDILDACNKETLIEMLKEDVNGK